ncbi:MAG: DUF4143 domain-containing protein, partial [Lentisphaerota bacterium]
DLVVIDEAQRISNIGLGLKILIDQLPDLKVIASGSSSFELSSKIGEPLTGRQKIITLYPLSFLELKEEYGPMHSMEMLESFLIYGMYPETITNDNTKDKIEYITSLKNSYLFKDILELEDIRNSDKLLDLLKLISFQIGKEVSLNELSTSLGLAKQTIERYLDLLEKAFVIKKVHGFSSGNLRKEVTKTCRYYFLDNGIRNAVINNFNPINLRDDIGMLWENFLFSERLKKQSYHKIYSNIYFWRTYDRKEIDLVEERDGKLYGYEFKWGNKKVKEPALWKATYSNAQYEVITKENYLDFIC